MSRHWRLILAVAAFVGWLGYLGYATRTKSRGPFVSHAQAAAARYAVVGEVEIGPDGVPTGRVKVVEALTPNSPAANTTIFVTNLAGAQGFTGPGDYLLLLIDSPFATAGTNPTYSLVGQQRSPGNDLSGVGKPLIYRWNDDVRKQIDKHLRQ